MVRFGPVLAAIAIFLTSCDQSANRVSTLWTNVPEAASFVEKFNASQQEWQILVEYKEDLSSVLTTPGRKADLVMARGLASSAVKDSLVPLDFLFDGGNLAKASFYRGILEAGQQGDHVKLLPVSFDLPVLVFSRKNTSGLPGFSLDLPTVRDWNKRFDAGPNTSLRRKLSFSPRWGTFGLTLLELEGANFREGFQGSLTWDSGTLDSTLSEYQKWPSPGWDKVNDFYRKYLVNDAAAPLASGRIQFFPSTLSAYLDRPWQERRDLDFRFVDQDGKVAASDNVVWTGIPASSLTRGAGEHFLAWLFQEKSQELLIQDARSGDDRNFGLAQGLSALIAPNQGVLVKAFPEMGGRIPAQDQVSFWPGLPLDWNTLKTIVIRPWLDSSASSESTLSVALEKHRTQVSRN